MAPDGEELDGYLLGVFEALSEFKGKCIPVIHRLDDEDDKLILVPQNSFLHQLSTGQKSKQT